MDVFEPVLRECVAIDTADRIPASTWALVGTAVGDTA